MLGLPRWLYLRYISAAVQIPCDFAETPTLLERLLRLSMNPVDSYLHSFCSSAAGVSFVDRSDKYNSSDFLYSGTSLFTSSVLDANPWALSVNDDAVKISTWPQWSNITSQGDLRLQGYAYATPCCDDDQSRANYVAFLLRNLTGDTTITTSTQLPWQVWNRLRETLQLAKPTLMPVDYLSFSVYGARVVLESAGSRTALNGTTNGYGHFEAIGSVSPPFENRFDLHLKGCRDYITPPVDSIVVPVSAKGLTIVSDVDDVLRIAEIWDWQEMFKNLFVRDFKPWRNMPEVYKAWKEAAPGTHFHYYSDAPEMSHRYYVDGVERLYPAGTYGFRPMQIDTLSHILSPRYNNIKNLVEAFPERRFVLVGDTATGSVLSAYGALAKEYPQQIQCILIRDVSYTEPANWIEPNLKALPTERHRLFGVPSDLLHGSESLMTQLANGQTLGCGDLTLPSTGARYRGNIGSWIIMIWKGLSFYAHCMIRFDSRPDFDCPFDRRSEATVQDV